MEFDFNFNSCLSCPVGQLRQRNQNSPPSISISRPHYTLPPGRSWPARSSSVCLLVPRNILLFRQRGNTERWHRSFLICSPWLPMFSFDLAWVPFAGYFTSPKSSNDVIFIHCRVQLIFLQSYQSSTTSPWYIFVSNLHWFMFYSYWNLTIKAYSVQRPVNSLPLSDRLRSVLSWISALLPSALLYLRFESTISTWIFFFVTCNSIPYGCHVFLLFRYSVGLGVWTDTLIDILFSPMDSDFRWGKALAGPQTKF